MISRRIRSVILLTIVTSFGVFAVEKNQQVKDFNELERRLLAATDRRDAQDSVFDEAIEAGNYKALVYLGQIGGEACERLKPYLSGGQGEARTAALMGAALCHDKSLVPSILANQTPLETEQAQMAQDMAFGFAGDAARHLLVDRVNELSSAAEVRKCQYEEAQPRDTALFSLMQSLVYDQLDVSKLPNLNVEHVLALTEQLCFGYHAAYLLGRINGLPDVLQQDAVVDAVAGAGSVSVKMALIRSLRQYGDAVSPELLDYAEGGEKMIAYEAIRALGQLSDDASLDFLVAQANAGPVHKRHLALSALAARDPDDEEIDAFIAGKLSDANPWIAVTALRGLAGRDPATALSLAKQWLAGDDYYRAFSALVVLTRSDEGKATLEAYALANPGTVRGREAAIALDPSIEAAAEPRKTPDWSVIKAYADRMLVLETTKGQVCITASGHAPYAATNFFQLADFGRMDGMLWHRVIPNFVAQAGQIENPEINNWGSIREEWGGAHVPGAVGVATAGRDTGGTQFFINTAYNMHLNDRYTVFGNVVAGMDVVHQLEEGDQIVKASTVDLRSARCK